MVCHFRAAWHGMSRDCQGHNVFYSPRGPIRPRCSGGLDRDVNHQKKKRTDCRPAGCLCSHHREYQRMLLQVTYSQFGLRCRTNRRYGSLCNRAFRRAAVCTRETRSAFLSIREPTMRRQMLRAALVRKPDITRHRGLVGGSGCKPPRHQESSLDFPVENASNYSGGNRRADHGCSVAVWTLAMVLPLRRTG